LYFKFYIRESQRHELSIPVHPAAYTVMGSG